MNKLNKKLPTELTKKIYSNVYSSIITSEKFSKKFLEIKTKYFSLKRRIQLYQYYGIDLYN